jgi:hypothetical protein
MKSNRTHQVAKRTVPTSTRLFISPCEGRVGPSALDAFFLADIAACSPPRIVFYMLRPMPLGRSGARSALACVVVGAGAGAWASSPSPSGAFARALLTVFGCCGTRAPRFLQL